MSERTRNRDQAAIVWVSQSQETGTRRRSSGYPNRDLVKKPALHQSHL
ncbi:MAG TPA: hypothetical protein IGS52_00765 [Oscillatoriaceae cyanobacterium M33_DOE_052]|nr:hypothetical protein [Oscillatoriaceae cyanobacterium M33_DOE_052]